MTEYDLIRIWINQFPIILQRFNTKGSENKQYLIANLKRSRNQEELSLCNFFPDQPELGSTIVLGNITDKMCKEIQITYILNRMYPNTEQGLIPQPIFSARELFIIIKDSCPFIQCKDWKLN